MRCCIGVIASRFKSTISADVRIWECVSVSVSVDGVVFGMNQAIKITLGKCKFAINCLKPKPHAIRKSNKKLKLTKN